MEKLKIIFAGTSFFAEQHLHALIKSEHEIIAVITQPDRPSGRGKKIHFSHVKTLSQKYNLIILQPLNLYENTIVQKILTLNANIMIVVEYGNIIPKSILTIFKYKCINVHASLLPRWRGATPIQSAILYGDKKTGITIIEMNEKIDAGMIISSKTCNISLFETTQSLSLKLINIGILLLSETLNNIINNKINKTIQNEKYYILSKKIYKKDGLLNWKIEAKKLERYIRAFNPWPICYFKLFSITIRVWKSQVMTIKKNNYSIGEIIQVNKHGIQINTSRYVLNIQKIQMPGKKIIHVAQALLSKKKLFKIGTIL